MAKDKKSFILYSDLLKVVEKLPDDMAGKLFKIILRYVNDLEVNIDDLLLDIAFEPIKLQLKRDLVKFEEVKVKRSVAGKRSAELRALKKEQQTSTNPTSVESVQQVSTNPTDSVNENDTVHVTVNDIDIKDKKKKSFNFRKALLDFGFEEDLTTAWLDIRKKKKAINSEISFKGFLKQVKLSGIDKNEILTKCVEDSWKGFKAEWLKDNFNNKKSNGQFNQKRSATFNHEQSISRLQK